MPGFSYPTSFVFSSVSLFLLFLYFLSADLSFFGIASTGSDSETLNTLIFGLTGPSSLPFLFSGFPSYFLHFFLVLICFCSSTLGMFILVFLDIPLTKFKVFCLKTTKNFKFINTIKSLKKLSNFSLYFILKTKTSLSSKCNKLQGVCLEEKIFSVLKLFCFQKSIMSVYASIICLFLQVRGVEIGIVLIVLVVWVAAIALFFNRWGKIRMLLPYQPDYKQEQLKVPGTAACAAAVATGNICTHHTPATICQQVNI